MSNLKFGKEPELYSEVINTVRLMGPLVPMHKSKQQPTT